MKENNLDLAKQDIEDALKEVESLEAFIDSKELTEDIVKEKFLSLNNKLKQLESILISEGIL